MTLLENLWYGNVDPHETFLDGNRQFKSLLALLGKNRNTLEETLTDLQKKRLKSTTMSTTKCTLLPKSRRSPTASGSEFS